MIPETSTTGSGLSGTNLSGAKSTVKPVDAEQVKPTVPEEQSFAQKGADEYGDIVLDEFERSNNFKIYRFGRPWYRAFHFSWLSFFTAFTGWFAFIPALDYLVEDPNNDISIDVVKNSNIISVAGTILVRFAAGPLCEKYGPRRVQTFLLTFGAVVVGLSALTDTASGLLAVRFFIGLIGGAFVPCQYWMSMMFAANTVGTANAVAGGWGNLGGGFANIFVGGVIKLLRENAGLADNVAWRVAFVFPALFMLIVSIPMFFFADDCPQGLWQNRKYNAIKKTDGDVEEQTEKPAEKPKAWVGFNDYRVWILALQYAACFGVELTINGSMAGYFYRNFLIDNCTDDPDTVELDCSILGKDNASLIAGCFGLMNLFARALGGLLSDNLYKKFSLRGRLIAQFVCLFFEGVCLIIFSRLTDLPVAIFMLLLFSVFVQASEGTTFSIVPFMVLSGIGQVAGIVGAGGNLGAVCWNTMIANLDSVSDAYFYLGFIVMGSSFLTMLYPVQGTYLFSRVQKQPFDGQEDVDTTEKGGMRFMFKN